MVLSALTLVACADKTPAVTDSENTGKTEAIGETTVSSDTDAAETNDLNYIPEFSNPEQYKGETLTMLVNNGFWAADDIWVEEESDDPVNSAIYQRNHNVMDKYDITIECVQNSNVSTTLQNAIKSGVTDYDVAVFCAYEAAPLAANGIFYDLSSIETLNLGKYYWDQNMFDGLSIDNKLFYVTGDLSTKANRGTFLMLYNKTMAKSFDLENLYDLVRNGTWTIDKLNEIVSQYGYVDKNGNSKVDTEDTFGIGIQVEAYLAYYFGCGGTIVTMDSDNLPVLNLNTQKNISIIEKIYDLTRVGNKAIDSHEWFEGGGTYTAADFASVKAFNDDRALFILTNAGNIAQFREMSSDFGVLPIPKFDADQTDYYSYVYYGVSFFTIPMNNTHPEFTGFALEALAAESYKLVTPAYYEQTLKGKYQRDADSFEMMDIAFRNRVWDLGYFGRFGAIDASLPDQIKLGASTFTSYYDKIQKATNKAIDDYIETYLESGK